MGLKPEDVLAVANQYTDEAISGGGGITVTLASDSFNKQDAKLIVLIGTDQYSQTTGNIYPIEEVNDNVRLIVGYDEQRCGFAQFTVTEDGLVTWTFGGNKPPSKIYLIN